MTIIVNVAEPSNLSAADSFNLIDWAVDDASISNITSSSFDLSGTYNGASVTGTVTGSGFTLGQIGGFNYFIAGTAQSATIASNGQTWITFSNINIDFSTFAPILYSDDIGQNNSAVEDYLLSLDWDITLTSIDDFAATSSTIGEGIAFDPAGDDVFTGKAGADTLFGGGGDDTMNGGAGNDFLTPGTGSDEVNAGDGNDQVYAGSGDAGNDVFYGGDGNDTLGSGAGNDSVYGEAGNDVLFGGTGADYISGGAGTDTAWSGNGDDTVIGGDGADIFGGGGGADSLLGGAGNDTIYGAAGNDIADGAGGNDQVYGGDGNDTLTGGAGDDSIFGGSGNDTLVFEASHGDDYVGAFETKGDNTLDLSALNLSGFGALGISQSGADVVIDTGEGTITLWNTNTGDVTANDFVF